jgi:hypothetical protein
LRVTRASLDEAAPDLAMHEPGRTSKAGKKFADGELHASADKLLSKITADDNRAATP